MFEEMLIKMIFLGTVCMVNLASVFCYTNIHAQRTDNVFILKDEHVGIDTYTHAWSDIPEILNV